MSDSAKDSKIFTSLKFRKEEISNYVLSIDYSQGNLFVAVSNLSELLYFNYFQWNTTYKSEQSNVESALLSIDFIQNSSFKSVHFQTESTEFTLIPNELFEESKISEYLEFILHKKVDNAAFQQIENLETKAVYSFNKEIVDFIFNKFNSNSFKNTSVQLIENLIKSALITQDLLHIKVNANRVECILIQERKLIFTNFFEYQTAEELMFYILSIAQQFNLNREKVKLQISGSISADSKIFQLFLKYFYTVKFVETNTIQGITKESQIACYPFISDLK